MKKLVQTQQAPAAMGPYSQAIAAGDFLFISGQIPLDPGGTLVAGDIRAQTERCLKNIKAILKEARLDFSHVVKTTVYMTDLTQFPAMNEVYAGRFKEPFPARAAVQVSALPKGVSIEIEALAVKSIK
ncbi:MAG: reactive intermediate/imine deaminase [Elusimicrobia bacterium RIFCSPHIGHO2_02_FULL_57_9]|nr:MAG: reactive intermediate/imine deaminase [Elusimicrobia bacterium RIFCSPHIGHO2_02_FULL_57_9]